MVLILLLLSYDKTEALSRFVLSFFFMQHTQKKREGEVNSAWTSLTPLFPIAAMDSLLIDSLFFSKVMVSCG